jgi:hypothetical protein
MLVISATFVSAFVNYGYCWKHSVQRGSRDANVGQTNYWKQAGLYQLLLL